MTIARKKDFGLDNVGQTTSVRVETQQVIDKLYGRKWRRFTINKKTGEITYK